MKYTLEELDENRNVNVLFESTDFKEIISIISHSFDSINKPDRVAIKSSCATGDTIMSFITINKKDLIDAGLLPQPKVKAFHL